MLQPGRAGGRRPIVLLLALLLVTAAAAAAAGAGEAAQLPACRDGPTLPASCAWSVREAPPGGGAVSLSGPGPSTPAVILPAGGADRAASGAGYSLQLQRLVLLGTSLPPPSTAGVPRLWPLGLFSAPGANLSLTDVRLVVAPADLAAYAQFMAGQSRAAAQYHTDGSSFLHIADRKSVV